MILEREEKRRFEELSNLKSEFVSYVSHEFRTPLTSIKMFTDLVKRRVGRRDGKTREYLEVIEGESERLNRMVTNVLDAARIDKGVKEYVFLDVDLREIARHVVDSMRYQIRKNRFNFAFKQPRRELVIRADRDAVAQAIINLISNAMKYSSRTKHVRVELLTEKGNVLCRVTDRGDGIPKEAMAHLFTKFYRGPSHKRSVQGVGLGLSLVKHIMDAHGGKVHVRSAPGKGSTFTLSFPITQSKPR